MQRFNKFTEQLACSEKELPDQTRTTRNAFHIAKRVCWSITGHNLKNLFHIAKRVSYRQTCFISPNVFHIAKRVSYRQMCFISPNRQTCFISPNVFHIAKRVSYRQTCFISPNVFHIAKRVSYRQTCFISPNVFHIAKRVCWSITGHNLQNVFHIAKRVCWSSTGHNLLTDTGQLEVQVNGHVLYVRKGLVSTLSSVFSLMCSGMKGMLRSVPDYMFRKFSVKIRPLVINEYLEVVNKFCCLGEMISAGGIEESIVARIRCGWRKFRELLPVLTWKVFSLCTKGKVCVKSVVPLW